MDTMRLRRHAWTVPALVGITLTAALVGAAHPALAADDRLQALLNSRLHNPRLGPDVALIVLDAATGAVLADHRAGHPQLPASNMKIVTAVTALTVLGPEARFTTRVRAGATASDIVLQGGGDPLLSSADLKDLARQAATRLPAGQPVVVHVDDTLFAPASLAPGWPGDYIPSVVSNVSPLGRVDDYRADTAAGAAKAFVDDLVTVGIPATVGASVAADPAAASLGESAGHTVAQDIAVMLRVSENNVAEVLYRQVAIAAGQPPTWAGGRAAATQTLQRLGLDTTGIVLDDGSGLSREDRVTPELLAQLLRLVRVTNPAPYAAMFADNAMPIAGRTGTLMSSYGRFTSPHSRCAAGAIRAKTGTLFDTIGLSGTAQSPGGERLFSILVNHRPQSVKDLATRQAVDGLAATITGCWTAR